MNSDPNDPRTFHVEQDREGWFIADDTGWPVETHPERRYTSYASAHAAIADMVAEADEIRRQEEDGPTDDQVMNGFGMEGGVRYRT